ncbi:MAG: GlsB/YeaQ/YmgE family stress response membrane protein [Hyphomicrobiales bacterium]|nr:GlsB/YeaQ/YmgE family stress response membrane protein [Hyphomicrobiales bacterium]
MTAEAIIIWLVIGAVAGFLAGLILQGGGFGLVGNIIVGILGAFFASLIFPALGVGINVGTPIVNQIVVATLGAVILLFLIGLIRR